MKRWMKGVFVLTGLVIASGLFSQNYELVWEDNFDGTRLDSSIWNIEERIGVWNTGANSEFQHYRSDNVQVGDDGDGNNCLILTAKEEDYKGYSYTSGKVTTKGKLAFRRGKLEAMIKIPDLANGLWPAFWTLGYTSKGWPDCGEIDVLEMGHATGIADGHPNSFIGAHLFWGPYPRDWGTEFVATDDLSTGYFKHTVIWDETKISVYFNDAETPYFSMGITGDDTEEYRDYQHYIILNMAVGGSVPGIYNKADITAPFPANMYVDWVKIYQEENSSDINNSNLAIYGDYAVFDDQTNVPMYMNHNFDLFDNINGLVRTNTETAFEGDKVLSYTVNAGADYNLSLHSAVVRNMQNYSKGSIQFAIKTDLSGDLQVGISDTSGTDNFITINDASDYIIERNDEWQVVSIALADFASTVDLTALSDLLIIKGTSGTNAKIAIDKVLFKEVAAAKGYYAINTNNPAITEGFIVDNISKFMYIWDGTVAFNDETPAYEGEGVLSFKATGAQSWCGYGYNSSNPLNLQAYADGYLNISIRASHSGAFTIGMDGEGSDATIEFNGISDPYGFERNGEWNHLSIPINDLVVKGLDLTSIKHVFKCSGGGNLANIAFDNIYLSEVESDIKNSVICYLNSISVSPATASIEPGETVKFTAKALNQFGNLYDTDITWSANGGEIFSSGVFRADEAGEYTITATQGDKSKSVTVAVENKTDTKLSKAIHIKSLYNSSLKQLQVEGMRELSYVTVIGMDGRLIYNKTVNNQELSLNMAGMPAGIYIIRVIEGNSIHTNKFIIK